MEVTAGQLRMNRHKIRKANCTSIICWVCDVDIIEHKCIVFVCNHRQVRACASMCVRACVRMCVRAYVRVCVRV